jgi:hypothetical protein
LGKDGLLPSLDDVVDALPQHVFESVGIFVNNIGQPAHMFQFLLVGILDGVE